MSAESDDPNNQERIANPELPEVSEIDLINILLQGADKPEAQAMLNSFCDQEEKKVELTDSKESPITFYFKLGLIYIKAGYIKEGLFSLEWKVPQKLDTQSVVY